MKKNTAPAQVSVLCARTHAAPHGVGYVSRSCAPHSTAQRRRKLRRLVGVKSWDGSRIKAYKRL